MTTNTEKMIHVHAVREIVNPTSLCPIASPDLCIGVGFPGVVSSTGLGTDTPGANFEFSEASSCVGVVMVTMVVEWLRVVESGVVNDIPLDTVKIFKTEHFR